MSMRFWPGVTFSVLLLVMLSGCQTINYVGEGPIALSVQTQSGYITYLNRNNPLSFLVTTDGMNYTYSACDHNRCQNDANRQISHCENKTSKKCKIFDRNRKIVWNGKISFQEPPTSTLPFIITWGKVKGGDLATGRAVFNSDRNLYFLTLIGSYTGEANVKTGEWYLLNGKGDRISGEFHPNDKVLYKGIGRDNLKQQIVGFEIQKSLADRINLTPAQRSLNITTSNKTEGMTNGRWVYCENFDSSIIYKSTDSCGSDGEITRKAYNLRSNW